MTCKGCKTMRKRIKRYSKRIGRAFSTRRSTRGRRSVSRRRTRRQPSPGKVGFRL